MNMGTNFIGTNFEIFEEKPEIGFELFKKIIFKLPRLNKELVGKFKWQLLFSKTI